MSEYQYYEFQAIDHLLSESDRAELASLSSRAVISASSAVFSYNYGDFRGDVETLVDRYFDMMLYVTNWGTRQLMFRFPKDLVDMAGLNAYGVQHAIMITTTTQHVILDISVNEEEGEWIDGEDWLSRMLPLREAILNGDYRALYLAWLHIADLQVEHQVATAQSQDDDDEDKSYSELTGSTPEPPIPPNLGKLNGALEAFAEFFGIDRHLISAAAENSPSLARAAEPIERWVNELSEGECKRLLIQVARGEPNMTAHVLHYLRGRFAEKTPAAANAKTRTIRELFARAEIQKKQARDEQIRKAEIARKKRLEALALREPDVWATVMALIPKKQSNAYEEAVKLLSELLELAEHQGKTDAFRARVKAIQEQFPTLSSLKSRMRQARLID